MSTRTEELQNKVNNVKGQMRYNINAAVSRGENLDELESRATNISYESGQFEKTARRVKRKEQCKHLKLWIILISIIAVIAVVVLLIIIIAIAVGVNNANNG
jgi:t-SNARE complex subunit (syntaxin)